MIRFAGRIPESTISSVPWGRWRNSNACRIRRHGPRPAHEATPRSACCGIARGAGEIPAATQVAATSACGDVHVFTATVSFPAGYWTEGDHTLSWEVKGAFSDTNGFKVDPAAPPYPGAVLLTNNGSDLQLLASDGTEPSAINPAQRTVARDIVGSDDLPFLTYLHNNFSETLHWDTNGSTSMKFGGLSSPCIYGGPYKQAVNAEWLRAYPLFLNS